MSKWACSLYQLLDRAMPGTSSDNSKTTTHTSSKVSEEEKKRERELVVCFC